MTDGSGRDTNGRFAAGNPGGPGGPRRRAFDLRRAAEEAITPEYIQALIRKFTRLGLEGNIAAARLVFERTCGRAAESSMDAGPIDIALPRLRTTSDCNAAIDRLMSAFTDGLIDRDAARFLLDAVQARLKAIEMTDLEGRLAELEKTAEAIESDSKGPRPGKRTA